MELETSIYYKFCTQKITIEKCININNKLILYFFEKDYNSLSFNQVIIQNTKTREEFICLFKKELKNTLVIDLSNVCDELTDYEGSVYITVSFNDIQNIMVPILSSKNSIIFESENIKTNLKWFIRILDNGELRLSSVVNKKL